ncbi:TetR family transcriptional regulator [Herbiconiux sp. KACC 21604]|uniref:TetR/AcrR family transcriptional regulator n=1 Tax=unclassified Herbiconiux TaxID=2618217 RepID=UPI00149111D4|nr:TetR family transcriptional regulator [Herbiconiux sp. SALV-R1]QJU55674.1 TetR family transcriptional regulator [Herbiconiux sp. SALV-R1]WPO86877.1 TetR family transcriptional regulator [Herbiconiux sp. KACC 21604]
MADTAVTDLATDRRESILAATVRCIARQGYDAVRLRDVSKEAGVSVGLLQHYFESRDELVDQAITFGNDKLISRWDDAFADRTARDRIVASIGKVALRPELREVSVLWVEFARAAMRHDHLRDRYRAVYDAWHRHFLDILTAGIADGSFRPALDPNDAVRALLAYFDGYELEVATGVVEADVGAFEERTVNVALALFGATR